MISTHRPLPSTSCPVEQIQVAYGEIHIKMNISPTLMCVLRSTKTKQAPVNE